MLGRRSSAKAWQRRLFATDGARVNRMLSCLCSLAAWLQQIENPCTSGTSSMGVMLAVL